MSNQISVAGNVGGTPELKAMQGGDMVLSFSLADNQKIKGEEKVQWFRCALFGKRAEALAPHIKSGRLKAFAVTSAQRSGAVPDLPTVEEAGKLKGFEASSWFGLLAPAGTPADIVLRIQQETAKALNSPAIKEKLLAQGAIPSGNTPQEFTRLIDSEIKKWAPVVKASGAKVD